MGSLDQPESASVKRKIKLADVTGLTPTQIENAYNTNYGEKGWRIVQVIVLGANTFILAEKVE